MVNKVIEKLKDLKTRILNVLNYFNLKKELIYKNSIKRKKLIKAYFLISSENILVRLWIKENLKRFGKIIRIYGLRHLTVKLITIGKWLIRDKLKSNRGNRNWRNYKNKLKSLKNNNNSWLNNFKNKKRNKGGKIAEWIVKLKDSKDLKLDNRLDHKIVSLQEIIET